MEDISTANGYNYDIGNLGLGKTFYGPQDSPIIAILPGIEEVVRKSGMRENNMTVTINGVIIYDPQTQNPSTVIEPLLGDIIHCMLGPIFVIRFTNGSTQINQGDLLTGVTSNATARVMRVRLTSGAWALGNAAGTIKIRDMRGTLQIETLTVSGSYVAKCSVAPIIQIRFNNLVDDVAYMAGGIETYPTAGEKTVGCTTQFVVSYPTLNDNPYLNT